MPNALENHDHFTAAAHRLIAGGEKLLRLGEACTHLNRTRGEKTNPTTLVRWILRGKRGVRLDAVQLNGKGWVTSREALARFAAKLSAQAAGNAAAAMAPTPTDRERRAKAAMDAMDRLRGREPACAAV